MSKCKIKWCNNEAYDDLYCVRCEDLMYEAQLEAIDQKKEMEKMQDGY